MGVKPYNFPECNYNFLLENQSPYAYASSDFLGFSHRPALGVLKFHPAEYQFIKGINLNFLYRKFSTGFLVERGYGYIPDLILHIGQRQSHIQHHIDARNCEHQREKDVSKYLICLAQSGKFLFR